ncbi:abortive infection system antitoxin AbiGi family protein [Mediterranea massiliensis]|uniref:abortive infection system antitoxin AbiGi family protein n=1 Tax=Mediterranea massiliensis TaxID=1841865 RepID=UPI00320B303C
MNIYSNSFFQRVKSHTIIQSILEEGFKAFYCKEEIYRGKDVASTYIGIPMICFCDIPLSNITRNNYGKCGIAMSRTWGRAKHLEPVLYYPNDISCQSTKMIIKAADDFLNKRNDSDSYRILGYAKPINKPTKIKGRSSDNYAEREWRKVYANPSPLKWLTEEEYIAYRGDPKSPKQPKGTPLHFKVDDIDFLLVDKLHAQNLQNFIVNELNQIGGNENVVTPEERWTLLSKILIYEDLIHNL